MTVGRCHGQVMQRVALIVLKLKFSSAQQVKPQHVNLGQNKSKTSSQAHMGSSWGSLTPAGIRSTRVDKAEAGQSWDWGHKVQSQPRTDRRCNSPDGCGQRTEGLSTSGCCDWRKNALN